jgi:hypothetical protein
MHEEKNSKRESEKEGKVISHRKTPHCINTLLNYMGQWGFEYSTKENVNCHKKSKQLSKTNRLLIK